MALNELIIKTKLFPLASRSDIVKRSGLVELLESASTRKLALVHAPAGYGKTTLLSQWHKAVVDKNQLACWLSIDEVDNDPVSFVRYLLCAYEEGVADFSVDAVNWMEGRLRPDMTVVLNHIINELIRIDKPLTFFIDDYHHINSVEIHQFVERLIDWSPDGFLLVMGSRVIPPLPMSKWRVSEVLIEVDVNMLRFNDEDAATFLECKHELKLSAEQLKSISRKSEGWVAGLQLVAIALKHYEQVDEFIASFSGNLYEIADYLMNNVLVLQSPDITSFLLKTSVLSRFNAEICNLLCERDDAQSVLEQMENSGLFILPLDGQRQWYRYHHLFHDFLISRLRRQYPHEVLNLYRSAAKWFREKGLINEAVDYALLSNDLEMIADIHQDAIAIMSMMGNTARLYGWLSNIPDPIKEKFPRLLILEGLILSLMNRVEDAGAVYVRLKNALATLSKEPGNIDPEELQCLEMETLVVPATIASLIDDNEKLMALTGDLDLDPIESLMAAILVNLKGYALFRNGLFEESKVQFIKAWQYYSINDEFYGMALVDGWHGMVNIQQLKHQDACRLFERSEKAAADVYSGNIYARGVACTMRAVVLYEWNKIDEAIHLLSSNLPLVEELSPPIFSCHGYITLSRCYISRGDFDSADNALNRCLHLSRHCVSNLFIAWIRRERLIIAGKNGENDEPYFDVSDEWVRVEHTISRHWDLTCHLELSNQIRADILRTNLDKAAAQVKILRKYAEEYEASQALLECLLLQAKINKLKNNTGQASKYILEGVKLAKPAGLLRTFVDEGDIIKELLEHCLKKKPMSPEIKTYIEDILRAFVIPGEIGNPDDLSMIPVGERLSHIEALSKRELEVLKLISSGKTNIEIADQLFIAKATVKFHISNIFSKLNVTNRTLAVATARSCGLLN